MGMYASRIITKMSLATPFGFRSDWSTIYNLKMCSRQRPT
jgi:hypothetical protein